jgi:choline kinase
MTDEKPKCMVPLNGKPLLFHQIEALRAAGVTELGIVTGYRAGLIEGHADQVFHNPRWADTNMVSSLAQAEMWLSSGPCLVSYSDIFYAADAVRDLSGAQEPIAITYDPNWLEIWAARFEDPLEDAESFSLTAEGHLAEIGKTARHTDDIEGQYMGLLKFRPDGWAEMQRLRGTLGEVARDRLDMTSALQMVLEAGRVKIGAVANTHPWGEVDSISDLAAYEGPRP